MIKRIVVTEYRLSSPYLGEAEDFDDLLAARDKALEILREELKRKIMVVCPSSPTAYAVAAALAGDLDKAQGTLDLFKDLAGPCINE